MLLSDISAFLRSTKEHRLQLHQVTLLTYLHEHDESTMTACARHLQLTNSALTTLSQTLVDKGLVRREHSRGDRRAILLSLTNEGSAFIQTITENAQHA